MSYTGKVVGLCISLRGHSCNPFKNRNKIVVIIKAAFRCDFGKREPGLFCQQFPGFFNAQISDMRCDSHPVVLFCDLIELCLSDTELPGETCGVQLFCKMGLDVFVDLAPEAPAGAESPSAPCTDRRPPPA